MVLTIYSVSDGPPSLACRMALKYLSIEHQLVEVDYAKGEFLTEEYAKKNPQKEIPVIDDNGFYLSESVAILQYLAEKYATDNTFYPTEIRQKAIVNHRLMFNLSTYYKAISEHVMAPIFFDYQRTSLTLKKVNLALDVLNTVLLRQGTAYAAGDHLTIGDLPLVTATLCLETISFSLDPYQAVKHWYAHFKRKNPDLWGIGERGMEEIRGFDNNPPKLPDLHHPIHSTRK